MRHIAKAPVLCLSLLLALALSAIGRTDPLGSPWEDILEQAAGEGKCLYVAFLGDGWSMASTRFSKEVLESGIFNELAAEELIYCPILARAQPRMGSLQTARLQSLVIHFDIKSYPTFILLAPDGNEILRHGYRDVSAEDYLDLLKAILPGQREPDGESGEQQAG